MIIFWIAAAVLVGLTLALLLPPLLRGGSSEALDRQSQNVEIARQRLADLKAAHDAGQIDFDTFDAERLELEQSLALDLEATGSDAAQPGAPPSPVTPILLAFLLPVVAGALYLSYGTPTAVTIDVQDARSAQQARNPAEQPSVNEMMARLKQRLTENPDDAQGWQILARSSMALENFSDAADAYERLNELRPNDPNVLVGYADALAMMNGGVLIGKPDQLIQQALSVNPQNIQGLWLGGMASQQRGEFQAALDTWQRLLPMLSNDQESFRELQRLIRDLRAEAEQAGLVLETSPVEPVQPAAASATIPVNVDLADALRDRVEANHPVFIFARAAEGPPMPLAAVRLSVSDLPAEVVLDDSQSMVPGMNLSSADTVLVAARVSISGQPTGASGDLQIVSDPISTAQSANINLRISQVVP